MTGVQTCALPICFPVTIPGVSINRKRIPSIFNVSQSRYDTQNGGERRIGGALDFMRSVLADDNFMSGPGASDTDMWKTASLWLSERSKYYASIRGIKGMDGYQGNDYASSALRDAWLQRSTMIAETNPRFQQFWVRYLDSDDLTMD